tara:strand:- start:51 stop:527 length:477 start_codon:yes stop_codon:yes gene_type:complete
MKDMSDQTLFPPSDLDGFLALCEGRWMSLRSRFLINASEQEWHSSERGEVEVSASVASGVPCLDVTAAEGGKSTLAFQADGCLSIHAGGSEQTGRWALLPDASLELELQASNGDQVLERIWFTKPNLRLRSTTAVGDDGQPKQGSFCSEIRRVSRPQS